MSAKAELLFGFRVTDEAFLEKFATFEDEGTEGEEFPFIILIHTYDGSDKYVCIGQSFYCTWGDDCIIDEINTPDSQEIKKLKDITDTHGIPWEEPKWILTATYW